MGSRELIESLRASGEGKVRALRAAAEHEAERIRTDRDEQIGTIRRSRRQEQTAAADRRADGLLTEAAAEAKRTRLRAERGLADRLARHALAALPSLRNIGYAGVFASFVQELPPLPWRTVRVNPADVALARGHFPDAEIVPEQRVSGGIIAQTEDGRITVVNTFETRLERIWEELLPEVMREVLEQCR